MACVRAGFPEEAGSDLTLFRYYSQAVLIPSFKRAFRGDKLFPSLEDYRVKCVTEQTGPILIHIMMLVTVYVLGAKVINRLLSGGFC